MPEESEERISNIESGLNRVNERVFNGFGEAIAHTKERVDAVEAKLNWFFATFVTLQVAIIGILLRVVL